MPFFLLPSPLPLSPLSGCVRRGGNAAPPLPPSFVTDPMTGRLRLATVPRQWRRRRPRRQRKRRSTTNVMVPTPDADPPMLNSRDDGGHRGDISGEYGDRDDVDDRDRCCRGSLGGRIGRATRQQRHDGGRRQGCRSGRGGHATLTLRGAFWEDDTDDGDDGDKQGQRARQRHHGAVNVWDALPNGRRGLPAGSSLTLLSDSSPEGPIVGDNRGKGRLGGSVADETTTDRVRTMATTE